VIVTTNLGVSDFAEFAGLNDFLASFDEVRRAASLHVYLHHPFVFSGGRKHCLTLDDVHADGFLNVNIGPWFDLRLFPNPINPPELIFTTVAREYEGGVAVTVPYDPFTPNPNVQIRQQGASEWKTVSVYPIPATTPADAAFRGSYTVDRKLMGHVDFVVEGADTANRFARRAFSVSVVSALAREGVLFWGAESGSHIAIPPVALTADRLARNDERDEYGFA